MTSNRRRASEGGSRTGNDNSHSIRARLRERRPICYSEMEVDFEDEDYVLNRQINLGDQRNRRRGRGRDSGRGSSLSVRNSSRAATQEETNDSDKTKTVLSWMIDMGTVVLDELVCYVKPGHLHGVGHIKREGIFCLCCDQVFTVPDFEMHVGSTSRQPYKNAVTVRGVSLLSCQVVAWERHEKSSINGGFQNITQRTGDTDRFDDVCAACGDGGDIVCCESCPSTFHHRCMGYREVPIGKWHCPYCVCRLCGIYGDPEVFPVRFHECHQCQRKYHQGCKDGEQVTVDLNSPCASFCRQSCKELFEKLQNLFGVKQELDSGFSWTLIRRLNETPVYDPERRALCNSKLAVALTVMNECFETIIDRRSGVDLVKSVVFNYGSNINRLNFSGFYTVILEKNDEIISVASIRILETMEADMPFIGTRTMYRHKGMCRRLLDAIESLLCFCKVEKLVIPSVRERAWKWIEWFGFQPVDKYHKIGVRFINEVVFPDAVLLQKLIPNLQPIQENAEAGVGGTILNATGILENADHNQASIASNSSGFAPMDLIFKPLNGVGPSNHGISTNQSERIMYQFFPDGHPFIPKT